MQPTQSHITGFGVCGKMVAATQPGGDEGYSGAELLAAFTIATFATFAGVWLVFAEE
jgi:hypothetical protein